MLDGSLEAGVSHLQRITVLAPLHCELTDI